jgi:predicted AAA+ superfamily ATPase
MESVLRFLKPLQKKSFFLFGPRGTGKSTWIKACYPEAFRIDLLEPDTYRCFKGKPEVLKTVVTEHPDKKIIIIDEVQKVPELLDVVHILIEEKKGHQFIMTGSSARKLKRAGVNLLAGRALLLTLHPFMAAELGSRFQLQKALQYGLLPLIFSDESEAENILKVYAGLYLQEEVMMEGLVRNIGNFARFLEAISFSHASLLNVSNVARESQVEQKTAEGYVQILEDLLLSFRLSVFSKRAKRRLVSHPKWYYFDAGVFRSIRPKGPFDRSGEIDGAALEGLVAAHLRAWIAYSGERDKLFFWRTHHGLEVDFVVYGERGIFAIEVKNSQRIRLQDLRSLRAFQEDYPESTAVLLYRGKDLLKKEGIWCIPCEHFLLSLSPEKSLLQSFAFVNAF